MTVTLNGKKEELQDGVSVEDLLNARKIRVEMVSIEVNDQIIRRERFRETPLKEGDRVEFIYYMGGGR